MRNSIYVTLLKMALNINNNLYFCGLEIFEDTKVIRNYKSKDYTILHRKLKKEQHESPPNDIHILDYRKSLFEK